LKLGGQLIKAILTFDLSGIKDAFQEYGDNMRSAVVNNAKNVAGAWKNAWENTLKGELKPVKQRVQTEIATPAGTGTPVQSTGNVTGKQTGTSSFSATKQALETAFAQEQNILKQQFLQKKLTKEQFNQEQYVLELAHLTAMRELYKNYGENFITIEGQIIEKKLAWQQQFDEMMILSSELTDKITSDERKMFADIDAEMSEHLDN